MEKSGIPVDSLIGKEDKERTVIGWAKFRSLMFQTIVSLALAEELIEFEHRDLHGGNVLLTIEEEDSLEEVKVGGKTFTYNTHGIRSKIIDMTLSRATTSGKIYQQNNIP